MNPPSFWDKSARGLAGMRDATVRHMGLATLSIGGAVLCAQFSTDAAGGVGAVRWGSACVLLGALYYLAWGFRGTLCGRERVRDELYDHPEEQEPDRISVDNVWMYVYGWGVLLFVTVYCLSGLDTAASCWWMLGAMCLVVDDLLRAGRPAWFTLAVAFSMVTSTSLLWCESPAPGEEGEAATLGRVWMGVVLPLTAPFILYHVKLSGLRSQQVCWLGLQFMVVLALCSLIYVPEGRRELGNSTYIETPAWFYATSVRDSDWTPALFCLVSPLTTWAAVDLLLVSVSEGFTVEYVAVLLLTLSAWSWAVQSTAALLAGTGLAGLG